MYHTLISGSKGKDVIGKTLLHYQILEMLGEGGMGAVYKARDIRLDRLVAIKILPPDLVNDLNQKQRFIQEAKAASALSHTNIVTVHDFNSDHGVDFIVMEYVRGKTLAQLIGRNGLGLSEALKFAIDIADALAKAHTAGIVHRDVKPSNIMVTEQGVVKVVDFGLAKLVKTTMGGSHDETQTCRSMTEEGQIVGTVDYMSPEQAEGKRVDSRSDIFSLGAVFYQMLTGRRPFHGETKASTIAAILREDPKPVSQIKTGVPSEVERIVRRCLRKDPAQRVQHMDDLKVTLQELKQESDSGVLPGTHSTNLRVRGAIWATGAAALFGLLGIGIWFTQFKMNLPEPSEPLPLTAYAGTESSPSFAPDGTQVAFTWCKEDSSCHTYIKQIGVEPPVRLTAAQGSEVYPAWSPDGRFIAFLRYDQDAVTLCMIPQRGGREHILAGHLDMVSSLSWTPDSKWIAFSDGKPASAIYLLSADTRERRRLTHPSFTASGDRDSYPTFSPDGRSLAFDRSHGDEDRSDIYVQRLTVGYAADGEPERLTSQNATNITPAWTADGREIVFSSFSSVNMGLWRIRVVKRALARRIPFAAVDAYQPAIAGRSSRLAYTQLKTDENIWRIDFDHTGSKPSAPARFIASSRSDYAPAISPDGKRIAFISDRSGVEEIFVCDADGSNTVQLSSFGGRINTIGGMRWSWDGQRIAFWAHSTIFVLTVNGGEVQQLTAPASGGSWPYWSRDAKSIYFASKSNIWRMRSTGGGAVQITRNSGDIPQESTDGKFLYYSKGWPSPMTIWRARIDGGMETKIIDSVNSSTTWTVHSNGIYFFGYGNKGRSELRFYEFATGNIKNVLNFERPISYGLTVSPEGRTLLYTQIDDVGSDLMLVENFR